MPTVYKQRYQQREEKSHHHTGASVSSTQRGRHDAPGFLTTFAVNPRQMRFETQEDEEKIILFLRQHFIVNVPWIGAAFLMLLAPIFGYPIAVQLAQLPIAIPSGYVVIGFVMWYVGTLGFVIASFIHWFFNIYIVTNERLVDIDFLHLLYKRFTQAELTRVQEISYTTGVIVATFFNYGTVFVQTAGDMPNLEFDGVPNPEKVVAIIREQMEALGIIQ